MYHYGIMLGMVQLLRRPWRVEAFADLARMADEERSRPSRVGLLNSVSSALPDNYYNPIKLFSDCSDSRFVSYQRAKLF